MVYHLRTLEIEIDECWRGLPRPHSALLFSRLSPLPSPLVYVCLTMRGNQFTQGQLQLLPSKQRRRRQRGLRWLENKQRQNNELVKQAGGRVEKGEHSSGAGCEKLVEHRHKKLKRQQKWLLALELQLKCNKRSANSRRVLQGQCRGRGARG